MFYLKRNELDLSKYEFDLILDELKEKLHNNSVSMEELISGTGKNKEKNLKVIQWLLDNNKIIKDPQELLSWNTED